MIEALTKEERNELREHLDTIDALEQDPSASNQLLQFRPLARSAVETILNFDSDNTLPLQNDATADATANPFVE